MKSDDWHRQNLACRTLANLGPAWCSQLDVELEGQLGMQVLQAAERDAMDADWLLSRIARTAYQWPYSFVFGIAVACVVRFDNDGQIWVAHQLRSVAQAKVEAIIAARGDGDQIIAEVCAVAVSMGAPPRAFLDELQQFVAKGPSPLFSAVYKRLSKAPAGS